MTAQNIHARLSKGIAVSFLDQMVRKLETIESMLVDLSAGCPREAARLKAMVADCAPDDASDMIWAIKTSAISLANTLHEEADEMAREFDQAQAKRILADMPDRRSA